MDAEDLREVISAYQKCVAETVQRFGGFVAKYMGDGVLVYFGYPQAHEDDAERAVRAGVELVAAVSGLKTHARLQTRVGIATGLVVVGDLIGSGASQEQAIVGETPNLAARLQGIAEPNSVVIAESTRRLVGSLASGQVLQPLKYATESISAFLSFARQFLASATEDLPAGFSGLHGGAGALADHPALFLGQCSVDVQHEWVGISPQLGHNEGHSMLHQAGNEMHVARQPIELGDDNRCILLLGLGYSLLKLRAFSIEHRSELSR
jgi:hypothetical protein